MARIRGIAIELLKYGLMVSSGRSESHVLQAFLPWRYRVMLSGARSAVRCIGDDVTCMATDAMGL